MEPMAKLFMNISAHLKSPAVFFILFGLITLGCISYAIIKQSQSIFLSIFYYLAFYFLPGLSIIRQEAAIGIFLLAYCYVVKRKFTTYVILCIIASLFHTSAIITLLFYPFFNIKSRKLLIAITISTIISLAIIMNLLLLIPIFASYYHYVEDSQGFQGGSIIRFITLGICIFTLLVSWKKKDIEILRIASLGLIGCYFTILLGGHIGGRIAEYFTILLCIGVPNLCYRYYKRYIKAIGISLGIFFIANIYISTKNPNKTPYTPYQFIFLIDTKTPQFR